MKLTWTVDPEPGENFTSQTGSFLIEFSAPPAPAPQPQPTPDPTPPPAPVPPPPPKPTSNIAGWDDAKAKWEANMVKFGRSDAAFLHAHVGDAAADPGLGYVYYDGARVFFQIADYIGDKTWEVAAQEALTIYRDKYLVPNKYKAAGYWVFPHGLLMDWRRNGNQASKDAVHALSASAAFGPDTTPDASLQSFTRSRETAYALMADLCDEACGEPHHARTDRLVNMALGHIDQWTSGKAEYYRPFMGALTSESLIQLHAATGDARVLPAIMSLAKFTAQNCWDAPTQSFKYTSVDTTSVSKGGKYPDNGPDANTGTDAPTPDLNLLIAPVYAWLYKQTGDMTWRDMADIIFVGGVAKAYLNDGKHFDQNYRWSFDYMKWRA